MRVGIPLSVTGDGLSGVADAAVEAERAGLDQIVSSDVRTDPLQQLTLAAAATDRIGLLTNIVVAFARSPMTLAQQAWALQQFSGGRLTLGLGSQVKPHIERRFSMPWSRPAARMAEYIAALRAIWDSWSTGERLRFQGDFYTHTLMTPMFTPEGDIPAPKVFLAAVGERMTEVAGQSADGLLLHPFTTTRYFRDATLPALERGRARSAAERTVDVAGGGFIVTGRTEEELATSRARVAGQIAFYGSTPAYRPVLEAHGWSDLGDELHSLSVSSDEKKWSTMAGLIDDDVIAEFAVVGTPDEVAKGVHDRWGDVCTHYQLNTVGIVDRESALQVAEAIRESEGSR